MICSICGNDNENGLKNCVKCGSSLFAEPFIPRLDAERVSLPGAESTPMPSMPGMNSTTPPTMNNPYMNAPPPPPVYSQIIGYDQNGMPVYAQPPPMFNQYIQPQIIGYDQNGMPVYAQPPPMFNQYVQPQIIGYDQNGMPVYSPPPMYNQYAQPQNTGYPPPPPQNMQGMQDMPILSTPEPQEVKSEETVDVPDDFWAFFDGGKSAKPREEQSDDFFGKSSHGSAMGDVSIPGIKIDSLKKPDSRKHSYMSDTPIVDASKLEKNDPSKLNQMYMKKAESVNSNDLMGDGVRRKTSERDRMGATRQADATKLPVKVKVKPKVSMNSAGSANADMLETYIPEHKEAIMGNADHAVEAMPKRVNPYQSELDAIELPEYMQAKKTQREETAEIPSIPKLKD